MPEKNRRLNKWQWWLCGWWGWITQYVWNEWVDEKMRNQCTHEKPGVSAPPLQSHMEGNTEELSSLCDSDTGFCSGQPQPVRHTAAGMVPVERPLGNCYHVRGKAGPLGKHHLQWSWGSLASCWESTPGSVWGFLCVSRPTVTRVAGQGAVECLFYSVRLQHYLGFSALTRGDKTFMIPPALVPLFHFHVILPFQDLPPLDTSSPKNSAHLVQRETRLYPPAECGRKGGWRYIYRLQPLGGNLPTFSPAV